MGGRGELDHQGAAVAPRTIALSALRRSGARVRPAHAGGARLPTMRMDVGMILLRPATPDDDAFLLGMRNDPELMAFGDSRQPAGPSWLNGQLDVIYAPVGFVRRDITSDGAVEVSIALLASARGRGVGPAALTQLRGKLRARVKTNNPASQRAFEKAGFHAVRVDPEHVFYETEG